MINYIQPGNVITLTAPVGGVTAGVGKQIGQLFVVPTTTAAAAAKFEGMVVGVFELPRVVEDDAWTEGELVYWDSSAGKATTTSADNLLIGCAAVAAADNDTSGIVRLDGVARPNEVES